MKKDLFFPALIAGIVFSAFFIFLVNEFATGLYTQAWFLFLPIPLILGTWTFYAICCKHKISSVIAIGCTIAFFAWIMDELAGAWISLPSITSV